MSTVSNRLQCVVVTPERTLLDEPVDFVALPLYDGEIGIGPGRAPLIGRLGFGEMRTKVGATTHHFFLDGGFVQVRDNVVSVLTNRAIAAEQIDANAAAADLDRARVSPAKTEAEQIERERSMDRARARYRVASKKS